MGSLPASKVSILRASLSTPVTSFPLSARQVAVTSPTYPVPTTATLTAYSRGSSGCYTARPGPFGGPLPVAVDGPVGEVFEGRPVRARGQGGEGPAGSGRDPAGLGLGRPYRPGRGQAVG